MHWQYVQWRFTHQLLMRADMTAVLAGRGYVRDVSIGGHERCCCVHSRGLEDGRAV